jgi:hypothetical protein
MGWNSSEISCFKFFKEIKEKHQSFLRKESEKTKKKLSYSLNLYTELQLNFSS